MPTFIDNNDEDKLNLLMNKEHVNLFSRYICDIYKKDKIYYLKKMFDKCAHLNLHAGKPVWAGCISSLYYIIPTHNVSHHYPLVIGLVAMHIVYQQPSN